MEKWIAITRFQNYKPHIGLLEYIYCNKIKLTEETVYEFFEAADKYSLPKLQSACELFIIEHLKVSNAIDTVIFAEKLEALNLKPETTYIPSGNETALWPLAGFYLFAFCSICAARSDLLAIPEQPFYS